MLVLVYSSLQDGSGGVQCWFCMFSSCLSTCPKTCNPAWINGTDSGCKNINFLKTKLKYDFRKLCLGALLLYIVKRKRPGSSFCDSKRIFDIYNIWPTAMEVMCHQFFSNKEEMCCFLCRYLVCVCGWVVQPIFKRIYKRNMGKYMMSSKHYPNKLSSKNQTKLDSQTMSATSHSHADYIKTGWWNCMGESSVQLFFFLPPFAELWSENVWMARSLNSSASYSCCLWTCPKTVTLVDEQ